MGRKIAIFGATVVLILALYIAFYPEENFDPEVLRGRSVVVTGASTGIGEQMAYYFAKHGANLLITARRENLLQKVTEECRSLGGEGVTIDYIKADMSNMEEARGVIKKAFEVLGGIDHLVLNHAALTNYNMWTHTSENVTLFKRVMDVNVNSFIEMTSLAWPQLNDRNGTLTIVSSLTGKLPNPGLLSYSASKHALQGFYVGLQGELAQRGSNASITVAPLGPVATDTALGMFAALAKLYKIDFDKLNAYFPMGNPADCAYEVIRASILRKKEIYYPRFFITDLSFYMAKFFPDLLQSMMKPSS